MNRVRLDQVLLNNSMVYSRSQAESYIKLGKVRVDGRVVTKPGHLVSHENKLALDIETQYVSRAALKLASVVEKLELDFRDKLVLDVGSSTGGFTDFALKSGAKKVIAVDVGTDQMHPALRSDSRIELHEKTDIRKFDKASITPDIVVIDVSFISLRQILPSVAKLVSPQTQIVAMAKPQFEANASDINKGVVKNDSLRRKILKDFESWVKKQFIVITKADSEVAGTKGNLERFYVLKTSI